MFSYYLPRLTMLFQPYLWNQDIANMCMKLRLFFYHKYVNTYHIYSRLFFCDPNPSSHGGLRGTSHSHCTHVGRLSQHHTRRATGKVAESTAKWDRSAYDRVPLAVTLYPGFHPRCVHHPCAKTTRVPNATSVVELT